MNCPAGGGCCRAPGIGPPGCVPGPMAGRSPGFMKPGCAWRRGQGPARAIGGRARSSTNADAYSRAADVENVRNSSLLSGRALASEEIGKLFSACADDSPKGARDAALLAVLYGCGLRRGELARLDVEDFDPEGCSIVVHGKRNKQRTVYLSGGGCQYLQAWLGHRGDDPGPLFCPIDQKGAIRISRLRGESVAYILKRIKQQAGVDHFSAHDLRRSMVTGLLSAGVDVFTVQKLAGHADVQTTARYDRRGEQAKRRAVQSLTLPLAA